MPAFLKKIGYVVHVIAHYAFAFLWPTSKKEPINFCNFCLALDKLDLRLGYYFDESPVQSGYFAPETPRNDSHGFTGGFSYQISSKVAIDASFAYLRFEEVDESYDHYQENGQEVSFGGTYKSNAFLPGLGVTVKL